MAATVASYRRLWEWLDPDFDIAHWGGRALASIRAQAPNAAEEIAGVAAGSGRSVEEIAALNARTEVLGAIAPRLDSTECSTVVSSAPGRAPLAVQTWDWYPQMRDNWFVWSFATASGRRVTTLTEYGVLAKIGVNDAGLGVMLNMLHHTADEQVGRASDRLPRPRAAAHPAGDVLQRRRGAGPGERPLVHGVVGHHGGRPRR